MKKILLFLLLLVNLQLTTDNGSLSIGFGEVAAQSMQEEYLDGVTVYGGNNWTHCGCGKYVARSAYGYHLQEECSLREILCKKCGHSYRVSSVHNCSQSSTSTTESTCQYCHNKKSQCNCRCAFCGKKVGNCWCSVTMTGKGRNIGYSVSGGSGVSGGSSGTNNTPQNSSTDLGASPSSTEHEKFPTNVLESMPGITLIQNLPAKLHPQRRDYECIVRAIALMIQCRLNLNDAEYQKVFLKLTNLAEKEKGRYNLDYQGIPADSIQNLFNDYCKTLGCEIKKYNKSHKKIEEFLKKGIPVATGVKVEAHMVTIIAFDDTYYYEAGGDKNGYAGRCKKKELEGDLPRNKDIFVIELLKK